MKRLLLATIALATLSIYSAGCNLTSGSSNQRLSGNGASDEPIACSTDADCPTGYECEVEAEHGTTTSLCKPHDATEAENEAGDDKGATGAGTDDTAGADDSATGVDDSPGADDSATGVDDSPGADDGASGTGTGGTGTGAIDAVCATDADCGAGLECEVEVEHGVTTATCQAHKSGKI